MSDMTPRILSSSDCGVTISRLEQEARRIKAVKADLFHHILALEQQEVLVVTTLDLARRIDETLFRKEILEISQRETNALSRMMQTRLPREIRDMIWAKYWGSNESEEYSRAWRHSPGFYEPNSNCPKDGRCHCLANSDLPLAVLPAFVGLQSAREAVLEFYKIVPPVQHYHPIALNHLQSSLLKDSFHLGTPMASIVRDVKIVVWDFLRIEEGRHRARLSRRKLRETKAQFAILKNIGLKRRLETVSVQIASQTPPCDIEHILEAFRDTYESLLSRGIEFVIKVDGEEQDNGFDVRDFYSMDLESWRAKHEIEKKMDLFITRGENGDIEPDPAILAEMGASDIRAAMARYRLREWLD